jgi:hypothetical protein
MKKAAREREFPGGLQAGSFEFVSSAAGYLPRGPARWLLVLLTHAGRSSGGELVLHALFSSLRKLAGLGSVAHASVFPVTPAPGCLSMEMLYCKGYARSGTTAGLCSRPVANLHHNQFPHNNF